MALSYSLDKLYITPSTMCTSASSGDILAASMNNLATCKPHQIEYLVTSEMLNKTYLHRVITIKLLMEKQILDKFV